MASGLAFTNEEYGRRVDLVHAEMASRGLDTVFVTDTADIEWLTGFAAERADYCVLVLPRSKRPRFVLSTVDAASAIRSSWVKSCTSYPAGQGEPHVLLRAIADTKLDTETVGVQFFIRSRAVDELQRAAISRTMPGLQLRDVSFVLASMRLIKSEAELDCIEDSLCLTEKALRAAAVCCLRGASEGDILSIMIARILPAGPDFRWPYYRPRVVVGDASAGGAAVTAGRVVSCDDEGLRGGQFVLLDCAASCLGYHGAESRTVFVGQSRPDWLDAAQTLLAAALDAQVRKMVSGGPAFSVYSAARDILDGGCIPGGHTGRMGYSIGLGTGPDACDGPVYLTEFTEAILHENMVLHLTPWLQTPWGGLTLSATAVVGKRAGRILGNPARTI
jgi:Xaa-Pro dipeptidase